MESKICSICLMPDQDEVCYGKFMELKDVNVHYFCLLSARAIEQNGKDDEGIMGFLLKDIKKSLPYYRQDICIFCKNPSAAVQCIASACDKKFHYICGFKNNCVTEFIFDFDSYCPEHILIANNIDHEEFDLCAFCYEYMGKSNPVSSVVPSCCVKHFIHRKCMMKYTQEAGYYTTCPLCDNSEPENFRREMMLKGIFVPDREASWETTSNFGSQVKNKCNFVDCPKPKATSNIIGAPYSVCTCFVCGCFPIHLKCAGVKNHDNYYCPKCHDKTFLNCFKKPFSKKKQKSIGIIKTNKLRSNNK
ncbi:unnamed protein product [Diamesa serratosioi]